MNRSLTTLLACPLCHSLLKIDYSQQRAICEKEQLSYPIKQGIFALLPENATPLLVDTDMPSGFNAK